MELALRHNGLDTNQWIRMKSQKLSLYVYAEKTFKENVKAA